MSVNGEAGGDALRIGLPIVDMVSGRGQSVDIALYDCGISLLHPHLPNYFASGRTPRRSGNAHPNIGPYDSYRTGSEPIFLAVGNDRQFARLCEYLGADELSGDPRFADNGKRSVNREALKRALEDYLAAHDGRELAERLIRLGVPCGAIAMVGRVVEHPHTRHRGMLVELEGYRGIASPMKLSRTSASYRGTPPVLGGDTREVLAELGERRSDRRVGPARHRPRLKPRTTRPAPCNSIPGSYHYGELEQVYAQHFLGLKGRIGVTADSLESDLRLALSRDTGSARGGRIDNRSFSGCSPTACATARPSARATSG